MSYFIQDDNNIEVLVDSSSSGKVRDWKGKKLRSGLMALHYNHAGLTKKAKRMENCANVLEFKLVGEKLKLFRTWFCKVRLCPMCNWRRSLKIASHNRRIVQTVNERHKVRWLFLTLTVRNCTGDKLKETVDNMMKSFHRFMGYKRVKDNVKGFFRALEITKNREKGSRWYGTYHPHFHILLCVSPSYFSRGYIKAKEWSELWKKAMKIDYNPVIDVKPVKPKNDVDLDKIKDDIKKAIEEENAVLEVSKYPVKDTDVLSEERLTKDGIETVYTLDDSISYKRLISYGGLMKEIHKELNLDDAENGDLININEEEDEIANGAMEVMAYWHIGLKEYVIKR